ncbi:MAG: NADH-quinone oxidoreductase subunit J [Limisphaerales bacterium]
MSDILFYIFAFLTLVFGFLVVLNPFSRSPVTSAMFLVLTIASLAALFVLLHAFFLAAVQVLVYAGAVMVLFLFVIMLLDLKAEERQKIKAFGAVAGFISVAAILFIFFQSLLKSSLPSGQTPQLEGGTVELGKILFTQYYLPFEVISLVLLVAMVGVILLSKKELK